MDAPSPELFSARQITGLLEGLWLPAVVINPAYEIIAANHAYTTAFAYPGQNLVGAHCFTISHGFERPCDQEGVRCPVQCSLRTGGRCNVIHEHHTREGPVREEVVTAPLPDDEGRATAFLETLRPLRVSGGRTQDEKMVGSSPAFQRMMDLLGKAAPTDTPVLLLGESGTGKELAARAVHRRSLRAAGPFVPVDCSGLAETLFESELLGHEKGAFTGATQAKKGLVEAAGGGTLFLDEVGDVPLSQQVKLLRILETGFYRRVGSIEPRQADFRLVCATHRNLRVRVEEGSFRRDLYYRISTFPVRLPPLRERPEDLEMLCDRLLQRLHATCPHPGTLAQPMCRVSAETLEVLRTYRFPGNVRELLNILQRACLLADRRTILPEHLPRECFLEASGDLVEEALGPETVDPDGEGILPLEEVERRYLARVAARFHSDRTELARQLGLSERTLYRKLAALRGG